MATTLKQWADAHGAGPVSRVVKRIERFAGNTTDDGTAAAATELLEMIAAVAPKKDKDAEPGG